MASDSWRIRQALPGNEPILRALRLEALEEAPSAFGSTLERELARTQDDWRQWLSPGITLLLDTPAGMKGIVAAQHDATDPGVVQLMAMWVHPALRGTGAATELVAEVITWANSENASVVRLDVFEDNARARQFYERRGFRVTGHRTVQDRDARIELRMERRLD